MQESLIPSRTDPKSLPTVRKYTEAKTALLAGFCDKFKQMAEIPSKFYIIVQARLSS